MEMVTNEIRKFAKKQEESILHSVNVEAIQLLDSGELVLMIERKENPFDLLHWSLKAEHNEVYHKHI